MFLNLYIDTDDYRILNLDHVKKIQPFEFTEESEASNLRFGIKIFMIDGSDETHRGITYENIKDLLTIKANIIVLQEPIEAFH